MRFTVGTYVRADHEADGERIPELVTIYGCITEVCQNEGGNSFYVVKVFAPPGTMWHSYVVFEEETSLLSTEEAEERQAMAVLAGA